MTTNPVAPMNLHKVTRQDASSTSIDSLFDSKYFDDKLKDRIEAVALDLFLRQSLDVTSPLGDDPFDAIYLSDLTPDPVQGAARNQLRELADIEDVSSEIDFHDDLDD